MVQYAVNKAWYVRYGLPRWASFLS